MGNGSGIGVLDKAVLVLHTVAARPANLAELTEATGLPRATAHRLAVGLETHQLLARDTDGRWAVGPAVRDLAGSVRDDLREAALMVLPRLQEATGESAQLFRREGTERVCIAVSEPPAGLRDSIPVGTRLPMTAGSAAKVLAAWAPPGTVAALLEEATFGDHALSEVRRRGWAQSAAERAAGVASVSAPVRGPGGDVVGAVSISGPIDRLGRKPGERWAPELLAAAASISARLT